MSAPTAAVIAMDQAHADLARLKALRGMSRAALTALFSGDARIAAPFVEAAARAGYPAAQLRLGQIRLDGADGARDETNAMGWFRRAARAGEPLAFNMVGRGLELGWGGAPEPAEAARWYERAAERGCAWGAYNLANLHFDGRGVAHDLSACVAWLRRAIALEEHGRALNLLARCREEGWGAPRDLHAAFDLYRRAAAAGYFRARFNYATLLHALGRREEALAQFEAALEAASPPTRDDMIARLRAQNDPALSHLADRVRGEAREARA
jgi:TPR repeat protein